MKDSMQPPNFARTLLLSKYKKKLVKNPRYSMRAFARSLAVSPSWLSGFFSQKKGISPESAHRIANLLELPLRQKHRFVNSVAAEFGRNETIRQNAATKIKKGNTLNSYLTLKKATWEIIGSWKSYAIIELLKMENSVQSTESIAERLKISTTEAMQCLENLKKCSLVVKDGKQGNIWKPMVNHTKIPSVPNGDKAIQAFHSEMLKQAAQSVAVRPPTERVALGVVLSANESYLPLIQKKMEEFILELDSEIDDSCCAKNKIFGLTLNAFPLS